MQKVTYSLTEKESGTWNGNLCDSQFANPMKQFLIGSNSQNWVRSWKSTQLGHNRNHSSGYICWNPPKFHVPIVCISEYRYIGTTSAPRPLVSCLILLLHPNYALAFFTTHYLDWLRFKINTSSNLVWNLQENYTL